MKMPVGPSASSVASLRIESVPSVTVNAPVWLFMSVAANFRLAVSPGVAMLNLMSGQCLGVADGHHVQCRLRRAVGELVELREGLLGIGHDREGAAAAGHHHDPRVRRRLQQGQEGVRDADRSVHVDLVHGVDLIDRCIGGRDTLPWRAGVVDQHVQMVRPSSNEPDCLGHRFIRGDIQRDHHRVRAVGDERVGGSSAAGFVARAKEDHPPPLTQSSGRFETESLVGSRDEHRGLRRVRHAEVTNGFAHS